MKQRIIAVILLCTTLFLLLCGCGKSHTTHKTIFIYMCGSDLETKQGLAGKNIDEILSANIGNDMNIVIETGGTQTWRSHDIDNEAIQRYEVRGGELRLLDSLPQANMGEAETLADFLIWGQKEYNSEQNMLVLWDHGGGSAKGVCFDENYSFDSLSLTELKEALDAAKLNKKFDFITFDACLMATIEVISIMRNYADYMIASEEIIPGSGMDYKAVCEAFTSDSKIEDIGKKICDAFMDKNEKTGKNIYSTLSLIDLSKTEDLVEQFNACAAYMNRMSETKNYFTRIIAAAKRCEKFGIENTFDGSSNMVDLCDFFGEAWDNHIVTGNDDIYLALLSAMDDAVPYIVNSGERSNRGVSFYYPLTYDKAEVADYLTLSVSEEYSKFLKNHYYDVPEIPIAFTDKGSISENGAFSISLTKESYAYLAAIDFMLMKTDSDGTRHILCTNNDIDKDYDNMNFKSNFRGVTLALNSHRMYCSALSNTNDFLTYETPVIVNSDREGLKDIEQATLQYNFFWDENEFNNGHYMMAGIHKNPDENGIPDNYIYQLESDVKLKVLTEKIIKDGKTQDVYSEEFEVGELYDEGSPSITEVPLDGSEYQYVFVATDIFGNIYYSDMATMKMKYTYEELLKNPLPDRTPAADITSIKPYQTE
ncbi:MAG: hypothetical protein IJM10_04165 [Clostridia bacterium]|nr:hypothetical protein [Clostridia bacterium]